jgi:hypothetical protein
LPRARVERTPRGKRIIPRRRLRQQLLRAGAPHQNRFFGTATESDEDDAGVQSIGSDVTNVTPGNSFELIARAS